MYAAIKAVYENGQVIFQEQPPTTEKTDVIIMKNKTLRISYEH